MRKSTLLFSTLLFMVTCIVGMRAAGFINFSTKNTDLTKENPVLSFIRDKPAIVSLPIPDSSRFTRIVLAQGFDEPLGMAILPNNDVLLAERKGSVKIYNRITKQVKTITNFDVFSGIEDGLLGIAIDPNFSRRSVSKSFV
jgi:glucose/arabinose dehydrogenase